MLEYHRGSKVLSWCIGETVFPTVLRKSRINPFLCLERKKGGRMWGIPGLWIGLGGLVLSFAGTILLLFAATKVSDDKDYGCLIISSLRQKPWYWGLGFLAVGFILQFIEKIITGFLN